MTTLQVKRRPVGRLSVAVGVQICSNASNFLLTMAVARAMTTDAVGVYAVIMSVTGILVGLVRAYTGEPISFGERAVADLEARGRAQRAVASSLVLGVCTVLLVTPLMLVLCRITRTPSSSSRSLLRSLSRRTVFASC